MSKLLLHNVFVFAILWPTQAHANLIETLNWKCACVCVVIAIACEKTTNDSNNKWYLAANQHERNKQKDHVPVIITITFNIPKVIYGILLE